MNAETQHQRNNVDTVMQLESKALARRTLGQRIADGAIAAAGSSVFIIFHCVWIGSWVLVNLGLVSFVAPFDRFPFHFLTLIISLEAIFLTLLILVSQNRIMKDAEKRAHLELQLNILAEQESTMTLRMLRCICDHFGLEEAQYETSEQLVAETDIKQLAKTLENRIPK